MVRTFHAAMIVFMLSGCASLPAWLLPDHGAATIAEDVPGHYSFAWRLSGDRAVAPLQVFDNGRDMWLQFAEGRALPAIFERTVHGDRPVRYERNGQYVVLRGVRPQLVLRGGHLTSFVDRSADRPAAPVEVDTAEAASVRLEPAFTEASFAAPTDVRDAAVPQADTAAAVYEVSPADQNLRVVLVRWARSAGWTFEPEHWAVDADIPVAGSARFDSTFKAAVQQLVASTELADQPLQPCFYSNKVLRIVPYTQLCDRTRNRVGQS